MRRNLLSMVLASTACIAPLACGAVDPAVESPPEDEAPHQSGMQQSPGAASDMPLLCPACSLEADAMPVAEPSPCETTTTTVTAADATALGYDVETFLDLIEGDFSAPVRWNHDDGDATTLSASIAVTTLRVAEQHAKNGDLDSVECQDALLVGTQIQFATEDQAVSGTLEGDATVSRSGEIARPLWVDVRGWQNDLRGSLALNTETLGTPQALRLWLNLLLPESGDVRLGLEVSGLYGQSAGEDGFTTSLAEAEPLDGCPAFTLAEGEDCVTVERQ